MKTLLLLAALSLSCKTLGPGVPPPTLTGAVDCALTALWTNTSFATLVPIVEHAIAQGNTTDGAVTALDGLISTYGNGEVACVVAYLHDLALLQKSAAPSDVDANVRIDVTTAWLAKHPEIQPTNYTKSPQ